jgi:hypothetical protein
MQSRLTDAVKPGVFFDENIERFPEQGFIRKIGIGL